MTAVVQQHDTSVGLHRNVHWDVWHEACGFSAVNLSRPQAQQIADEHVCPETPEAPDTSGTYTVTVEGVNFDRTVYQIDYADNPTDAMHRAIAAREEASDGASGS